MKYLPDVTLIALSSIKIQETLNALEKSCKNIEFKKVKIVTHELPKNLPDYIQFEECPKLSCIDDYNLYVFKYLGKHVDTSHCLLVQHDSWILNADLWDNTWLNYDYCGAPWPRVENAYIANTGERVLQGNGGFSLRSKKLCDLPFKMNWNLRQEQSFFNEDGNICCYWRKEMLENGIKYAPVEVAAKFSYENPVPENNFGQMKTFGFHKNLPNGI